MSDDKVKVPDGWVLMPRELTWEMRGAAQQACVRERTDQLAAIYRGFIEAAPKPPSDDD